MTTKTTRRSQETRRSEMRARLMHATVECLVEHGYSRTSTTMISNRAGVSRGAQLHHFPCREDLMLAAIEHVSEARRRQFRSTVREGDLPVGPERLNVLIGRMWEAVEGAPTQAWLELVVAARNNAALHTKVVAMTERLRAAGREELARLGVDPSISPEVLQFVSALMDGLVVQQMAGLTDDGRDAVLGVLKRLALLFASSSIRTGGTS